MVAVVKYPHGGGDTYIRTFDAVRIMDQFDELRGCDERLAACMLDRLGDLRRGAYAPPARFTTHACAVSDGSGRHPDSNDSNRRVWPTSR